MPITVTYVIERDGRTEISDQDEARLLTQFGQDFVTVLRSPHQKDRRAADVTLSGVEQVMVDVTTHDGPRTMQEIKGVDMSLGMSDECIVGHHDRCSVTAGCSCPCHKIFGNK